MKFVTCRYIAQELTYIFNHFFYLFNKADARFYLNEKDDFFEVHQCFLSNSVLDKGGWIK